MTLADRSVDPVRHRSDLQWLEYAVQELPAGVLRGPDGATPDQCAEMLAGRLATRRHAGLRTTDR